MTSAQLLSSCCLAASHLPLARILLEFACGNMLYTSGSASGPAPSWFRPPSTGRLCAANADAPLRALDALVEHVERVPCVIRGVA